RPGYIAEAQNWAEKDVPLQGQVNYKLRTPRKITDKDSPAVGFDRPTDNRHPQASAFGFGRIEGLKNTNSLFGLETGTVVADANFRLPAAALYFGGRNFNFDR